MSFDNPTFGGEGGELIRESIKSPDFQAGVQGWIARRDGSAEFNNVVIRLDLTTGEIWVGPPTGVQVHIHTVGTEGKIDFPTNRAEEIDSPYTQGTYFGIGALRRIALALSSGTTNSGSATDLTLLSGSDDGSIKSSVVLGGDLTQYIMVEETSHEFTYSPAFFEEEVTVSTNNPDSNYPSRVARGMLGTGATSTTLSKVSDTAINGSPLTNTYLENGVAYQVDVQIQTRSSVGTSAAGTQNVNWKLWSGLVGSGTQLGSTIGKYTDSVGNNLSATNFSFVFQYTGTSGLTTMRLSGIHTVGTDTVQTVFNPTYFMMVNRIGDPNVIDNA